MVEKAIRRRRLTWDYSVAVKLAVSAVKRQDF